jgi:hypothetical protein
MCTRLYRISLVVTVALLATACSGATPMSPTPLVDTSAGVSLRSAPGPVAASPDDALFQTYTVQFTDIGPDRAPVTTYTESGFSISTALADWIAFGYGHPGPSLVFYATQGTSMEGEVTVRTDEGLPLFRFTSVDLYSSVTPIPYVFTGSLRGHTMFTESGTLGNTFGNFVTVFSSHTNTPIDALVIRLANGTACCQNPMGLDNIVMRR